MVALQPSGNATTANDMFCRSVRGWTTWLCKNSSRFAIGALDGDDGVKPRCLQPFFEKKADWSSKLYRKRNQLWVLSNCLKNSGWNKRNYVFRWMDRRRRRASVSWNAPWILQYLHRLVPKGYSLLETELQLSQKLLVKDNSTSSADLEGACLATDILNHHLIWVAMDLGIVVCILLAVHHLELQSGEIVILPQSLLQSSCTGPQEFLMVVSDEIQNIHRDLKFSFRCSLRRCRTY